MCRTLLTWWFLFLLVLPAASSPAGQIEWEEKLTEAVRAYWDALQRRDKAAALQWVAAPTLNHFLQRKEPPFTAWKLLEIEPVAEGEAQVQVQVETLFGSGDGSIFLKVQERWRWNGEAWKVWVEDPSAERFIRQIYGSTDPTRHITPGELSLFPPELKIQFLNAPQIGVLSVRNGLTEAVRIVDFELEREKFELVRKTDEVAPGTVGEVVIRYVGKEIGKNRRSQGRLVLEIGGSREERTVPIVYNYFSDAARAFFGLTEEQAEKLPRRHNLQPVITPPKEPEPERKPPQEEP